MMPDAPRRIWLCADDYGLSPGVNRAIRELIERGRLNATSVMVVGAAIGRDEVKALDAAALLRPRCAIGLHATLSAPFHPLTMHFKPLAGGMFPPFKKLLAAGLLRQLDPEIIHAEMLAQLAAFADLFGRGPDFVDGHQHVQLFPQVRDAFLSAVNQSAASAWVRQGGSRQSFVQLLHQPKALLLDVLSRQFRRSASRAGLKFNPSFAGAYDFSRRPDFDALMADFLDRLPDGGVVMCHPGFVDESLFGLDPLTHQRKREYAFLASDKFPKLLAANNITLA